MKLSKLITLFAWVLAATLLVSTAFAQETTAGIQGTVKDPQGAVVANATVELTSPSLIGKKSGKTDSSGKYQFSALPPGTYELTVTAQNFRTHKQANIDLTAGRLPTIDVNLQLGAVGETVEVSSAAPMVDVTQSKVQVSVSQEEMANVPKGRSFQSLIPFAPGARQEPLQSSRGNNTNGFQVDGASDSENVYLIDGVNTTNVANGGVGKSFQTDFIQEVQVKSSSFEAEYGGALGGVVNAVPKHGSNAWHGEFKTYYQSSGLDASDQCASGYTAGSGSAPGLLNGGSLVCGLRLDPTKAGLSTASRLDGTPQYYIPKKDNRHTIEPGYDIGGPLFKDRLWLYSGYIPTIDTTNRTTTFTNSNPAKNGPRTLTNTYVQHNLYNRVDYRAFSSLNLYGAWNYAYSRSRGQLGTSDSALGQLNTGASTDPTTLRSDYGAVYPLQVMTFGGDFTPTSKMVISAKYGYFFSNTGSRGTPDGMRHIYDTSLIATNNVYLPDGRPNQGKDPANPTPTPNPCTTDISGFCMPTSSGSPAVATPFNPANFFDMPSNFATLFDAYKRKSWNVDGSYFIGHALGTHTFKAGYFWAGQTNNVFVTAKESVTNVDWGTSYQPVTSTTACDAIIAQNIANGWVTKNYVPGDAQPCQGRYGYFFTGSTTTSNDGTSSQTAQAFYIQDAWTVGHGLTLNLGLRLDEETQPPYDPTRFPSVHFGWGDKLAPRIGGAYDLFRNGKVKIYASYGKFFDIMKMGLARGSFGSDYWHECVYAMDFLDYTTITPTGGASAKAGCPASGPAPGVTVGRFIENVDFRATKADPRDPAIQPNMKPMSQHEFVTGVDWAITPNWGLETRYSRKRLDQTIEDMAITDNLGFYIGNPGSSFADVLHRPTVIPDANGNNYLNTTPFCAECPAVIGANRRYDGVEFRLTRRPGAHWYGSVSYTYSKLRGNYAGLTNSDPTDGNGGRHSPNNNRAFDIPTMTYLPNGKIDDGPLATDRPHTAKMQGYYRQKWFGMESTLGLIQSAFQGSPISSCIPVVGTSSACQWAEGRGNFAKFSRDPATGNFVLDGVVKNARTSPYFQTDLVINHQIKVSKQHESMRLVFEGNAYNLFNQHADVGYYEFVTPTNLVSPARMSRFSGDPNIDWAKVMSGYNYVDALNGAGAFAGTITQVGATKPTPIQNPLTLASRYGKPWLFQTARQFRLAVRFQF